MTPDSKFDPAGFARSWWDHQSRASAFEDHLHCAADEGFDFSGTRTDDYDSSVEIDGVPPDARLNEAQQKLLSECGFIAAFVNHTDEVETHYNLREVSAGWRRKTKSTGTGFVISYWPEGWGEALRDKWIPSGYMTVDPSL